MKRLIISADDFGFTSGVVDAILDGHRAGVITSTTAMVNMPGWEEGAARLRETPSLPAGVHLVFNEGAPVLPPEMVPTLVDAAGRFLDDAALNSRGDTLNPAHLKAEFRAQVERFRASGLRPTHLDNHCSISYRNPEWFQVTVELAAEYGIPMRLPFGDDLDELAGAMARSSGLSAGLIHVQGLHYQAMLAERGVRRPNRFIMAFSRDGGRTVENLLAILGSLPNGVSEVLTHPGYGIAWREEEIRVLLDPRVAEAFDRFGIRPSSFRDL